jgi:hypothetical protein
LHRILDTPHRWFDFANKIIISDTLAAQFAAAAQSSGPAPPFEATSAEAHAVTVQYVLGLGFRRKATVLEASDVQFPLVSVPEEVPRR